MDNEDKILEMLTELKAGQVQLAGKVDKLEAGQAKLLSEVIEIRKDARATREQTEDLVEFRAEVKGELKKINRKLETLEYVSGKNTVDIADLQLHAV